MEEIRIQKLLSNNGNYSRRKVEELLLQGRIKVNNKVINTLGFKCTTKDIIEVDNERIDIDLNKEKIYIALNKPTNYICSLFDPQKRNKIIDLIPKEYGRLIPVGRLDYDTSGLIFLTSDGNFCNYITHPSTSPEKEYIAICDNPFCGDEIEKIEKGIYLEELHYLAKNIKAKLIESSKTTSTFLITLHEGKKHEVKLILESVNHKVLSLKRIKIGSISLGNLEIGKFRNLTKEEIPSLGYKMNK